VPRGVRLVLLVVVAAALAGSEAARGLITLIEQRDFTVQAGQQFSGNVAIFHSDHDPNVPFTITVAWGDGSSSPGTAVFVSITPQQRYAYNVSASHTYEKAGTYVFTVTVRDGRDMDTKAVNGTATVTAPPSPPPPPAPPPPPPVPLPADLTLAQTQEPAQPRAGGTLAYTLTVRNGGPGSATGVTLTNTPPASSTFVSATVAGALRAPAGTNPCTSPPAGPLTCALGTLAPGAVVTVTHAVRLGPGRVAQNAAQVAAAQVDPVTTDNATTAQLAVAPPPPVLGRAANISPVSGVVLYRPRGSARFLPLTQETQIPTGSQIDTRRGRVRLQSARGGGVFDTADFYQGLFAIFQPRVAGAFAELRLAGGNFKTCPRGLRKPAAAGTPIRRLWGDGKGRFRTRGRFGSAAIRGTRWLTVDRCNGTFVQVQVGSVLVRDFRLNRLITVRAGQSYLARARP
jgi:uncharacterized repeat protein (TIGR01451 family)